MASPKKRRVVYRIRDAAQRAALASPPRQEVLEHLGAVGPATVKTVAERMGCTPHSLYYHLRHLTRVGLVTRVGNRRSGAREQAIYDVIAERFELELDPTDRDADELDRKTIRAALRRAEREFEAVCDDDPRWLSGDRGFVGRLRAPLPAAARKEVMHHLRAIQKIFARELRRDRPPNARTYALTAVFLGVKSSPNVSGKKRSEKT